MRKGGWEGDRRKRKDREMEGKKKRAKEKAWKKNKRREIKAGRGRSKNINGTVQQLLENLRYIGNLAFCTQNLE